MTETDSQVSKVVQRLCDHKYCGWIAVQVLPKQDYHSIKDDLKIYYTYPPVHEEYRYICNFCKAVLRTGIKTSNLGSWYQP